MTKIEALELELAARKMVEGTGLDWTDVIKYKGVRHIHFVLNDAKDQYELALGIIEGKPVWKRDTYYHKGTKLTAGVPLEKWFHLECSWDPPKPKTVMVELLVEDAEFLSHPAFPVINQQRTSEACRKALEEMK